MLRGENFFTVATADASGMDFTIDHLVYAQLKAGVIEETQHGVVFPCRLRVHLEHAVLARIGLQSAEQGVAVAMPLLSRPHADHFQPQRRLDPAEFALQPAREDIAFEDAVLLCGELRMQARRAQRRLQAALEIDAARAAGDLRVDIDHCVQVRRSQPPQLHAGKGPRLCTLSHLILLFLESVAKSHFATVHFRGARGEAP